MMALSDGQNADYQAVVAAAVEANPWFTQRSVRMAARNLATDMLSERALEEWFVRYPELPATQSTDILIVMAGNIPFVGVHDLVCVLAAGHRAVVKPSSKDSVLMRWVVAQLIDIEPLTRVSFDGDPAAVVAMGGDDAIAALGAQYAGLPALLRGHRSSLAVLDGTENRSQLEGLADDILSFSGLGCRNVSLIFVPRGYDFSLLQSIVTQRVNALNVKYHNNYRRARALMDMTSAEYIDCGACLLIEKKSFSTNVSVCHYAFYDSKDEVRLWISQHADEIQCVAGLDVDFGKTQHPTLLDYPDGIDTVKFLLSIR